MSNNNKKVSITKFESALDKTQTIETLLAGTQDVIITIKKILPLTEMMAFVHEVVDACIDGSTGEYIPEAYDFAIRTSVLTRYANFTMPSNLEKQYLLVYNTNAYHQVVSYIDNNQFNSIISAIDKKIAFMLDIMASATASKVNEIINKFSKIADIGEKVFGGSSPDEMASVIDNISKLNNLNEQEIANVVLDYKSGEKGES